MPRSHGFTLLRAFTLAALFVATAEACERPADQAPHSPGPRLTRVDSVALADTGAFALGSLANVGLHVGDSTLWIGDPGNSRVVRFGRDGRVLGQAGRRGLGPGEIGATGPIAALGDGTIAVWVYDVEFNQEGDAPAQADAWLTIVDPVWRRACVDAKLPLLERTLPSLAFRGDTLFTLEHVVTGDRTTPTLRAFVISTARCEWVELTEP